MSVTGHDTLKARRTLKVNGKEYDYFSLEAAAQAAGLGDIGRLPFSLKVLLENLVRLENGRTVKVDDIKAVAEWLKTRTSEREIAFRPARVLMQDFTGVPAVVDLAAMREAMVKLGGDPHKINPLSPVDLVIDHSVMVDSSGGPNAFRDNVKHEFERNGERYAFLRWGQTAFDNFRVVPPGTGICHQVNLEYLAQVVWTTEEDGKVIAYPDTLVGTDSHTTMVNGLSVLGWGVGGIEAEAAMLGQAISMVLPEVVGFKLTGTPREGTTATDLVLTVTQMLRKKGVVGRFVEFYGSGLGALALADRATLGNMAPEYGATCGFFPVDAETLRYLAFSGRDAQQVKLVEAYAKAQGLWRDDTTPDPVFTDSLELDLGTVEPSIAGPRRPQDRVALSGAAKAFATELPKLAGKRDGAERAVAVAGSNYELKDGHVVIAAITSCTNTSNPSVMLAAGLVARNAVKRGLKVKPWVKTSPGARQPGGHRLLRRGRPAEGSRRARLQPRGLRLHHLHRQFRAAVGAGHGSDREGRSRGLGGALGQPQLRGPHPSLCARQLPGLAAARRRLCDRGLDEGRSPYRSARRGQRWQAGLPQGHLALQPGDPGHPQEVAHAGDVPQALLQRLRGTGGVAQGQGEGRPDLRVGKLLDLHRSSALFRGHDQDAEAARRYQPGAAPGAPRRQHHHRSHLSRRLDQEGEPRRRIPHELPGAAGGLQFLRSAPRPSRGDDARHLRQHPDQERDGAGRRRRHDQAPARRQGDADLYAAMEYQKEHVPLVIIGGKEYGTGSSRDWAAKGTLLLGVKAVIVESFERIHRSNLVGMGVLPLQFKDGATRQSLKLDGTERYDILGVAQGLKARSDLVCRIHRADGKVDEIKLLCRIDTEDELEYYRHGGILQYVLRHMMKAA